MHSAKAQCVRPRWEEILHDHRSVTLQDIAHHIQEDASGDIVGDLHG